MTRLFIGRTRAVAGPALATAAMLALASGALAQTPAPQPEVTSAPKRVDFGRTATIRGELENHRPGDEVTLEERRADNPWRRVATKTVSEDGDVEFRRRDMRRTTRFRLVWSDEVEEARTRSDRARVGVRPRLRLRVKPNDTFRGRRVKLAGRLFPTARGRSVRLEQRVKGEWRRIARARVRDGRFSAGFEARHTGNRRLRVIFSGDGLSTRARDSKPLTVYRRDQATWYGPGFYGNRTACGKRLTSETLGVAHRTLPCGARVSILHRGRTITVPVIDRGPYSNANWDLTEETAERVRFSGSGTIGVTR